VGCRFLSTGHGRFSWETVAQVYYAAPDSVNRKRWTRQQAYQQGMVEVKQRWTFPKRRKCFLRPVDVPNLGPALERRLPSPGRLGRGWVQRPGRHVAEKYLR
jgi:hypothetical protein